MATWQMARRRSPGDLIPDTARATPAGAPAFGRFELSDRAARRSGPSLAAAIRRLTRPSRSEILWLLRLIFLPITSDAELIPVQKINEIRLPTCQTQRIAIGHQTELAPKTLGDEPDTIPARSDSMKDVLAMCSNLPEMRVAKGDSLIEEGVRTDRLYVLKCGTFEVVRNGVRVVLIGEPGAFLGEISAVLGSAPTASVVATQDSTVHVVDDASTCVQSRPELTYAIAQLLARRLSAVTAYLVDIKRQYADSNTHLALMDQVLGSLIATHPGVTKPGSERSDVPDY